MSRPRRQEDSAPPGIEQIEEAVRREVAAIAESSTPGTTAALWRAMRRRATGSEAAGLRARDRLERLARTVLHYLRQRRAR